MPNSIAEFNSTRRKCGFSLVYRFGDPHECRRTNEILLGKFLASLKGQHRWQKTAIKHYRNVPAFSSFSRHEVLRTRAKFIQKMGKYLLPANTFGWKPHKAEGRACHHLSFDWIQGEAGHFDLPRMSAKTWGDVKGNEWQRDLLLTIHSVGNCTSRTMTDSGDFFLTLKSARPECWQSLRWNPTAHSWT